MLSKLLLSVKSIILLLFFCVNVLFDFKGNNKWVLKHAILFIFFKTFCSCVKSIEICWNLLYWFVYCSALQFKMSKVELQTTVWEEKNRITICCRATIADFGLCVVMNKHAIYYFKWQYVTILTEGSTWLGTIVSFIFLFRYQIMLFMLCPNSAMFIKKKLEFIDCGERTCSAWNGHR